MAHVASTRGLGPHLRPTPTLRGGPRQGPAHVILAHGGQGRRATAVACGQCLGPVGVSSRHSSMKEGVKCASAEASRDECRHGTKGGDSNVVDERNEEGADVSVPDSARDAQPTPAVSAAMGLLRFYKSQISPLLPPSCRYIPTCSEYAMMAYKRHGFARGTVMTAWRLMRCNPLGGHGYDPPVWPPPGLRFLSWIE